MPVVFGDSRHHIIYRECRIQTSKSIFFRSPDAALILLDQFEQFEGKDSISVTRQTADTFYQIDGAYNSFSARFVSCCLSCSPKGYSRLVESITFGDLSVDSSELAYITQHQVYVLKNAINLITKTYDTDPKALDALAKQDIDLATTGEFLVVRKAFANGELASLEVWINSNRFY